MKGAAPRPLAPPLDLCVGLSLISALIYALVLRAPYPSPKVWRIHWPPGQPWPASRGARAWR